MLTKFVKYQVALTSKIFELGKNRNILIHHGLLGSAQSFSHPDILKICSKYANIHLIDARNHGKLMVKQVIALEQNLIA